MTQTNIPFYSKDPGFQVMSNGSYYCILELSTEETLVEVYELLEQKASEYFGIMLQIADMTISMSPYQDLVNLIVFVPVICKSSLIM